MCDEYLHYGSKYVQDLAYVYNFAISKMSADNDKREA